ncbi:type VII secretion-associated serine protease [Actinorhabdospora filicis]|uniref:Type VII secretion-associated serine protease n=1 Tax=Actinorhabdospora filicis TaxID=1785913 RepID=A0A9W6SK35_9ACTN|nr:S8 family serine peptidase [Actinorhabdospora filicis]GLZ77688.1 type VII secretion-associated serine protease [Actinorhabdospora filicis]
MMRRWLGTVSVSAVALGALVVPGTAWADQIRDSEWMINALRLKEAHAIATGEGVTVGILDTGVDGTHPDLVGQVVGGKDSYSPAGDGQKDYVGHGTGMASLIAGRGHGVGGGDGVLGVAPGAKILSYGAWPEGTEKYDQGELNKGLRWLIDSGADVILLAYSGGTPDTSEHSLIKEAKQKGIPLVSSSGNLPDDTGLGAPGTYPEVNVIGGTTKDGVHSSAARSDPLIRVAAPSEKVVSAWRDGGYSDISGTSKSAAIVAGVFALMKAHWPDISPDDMAMRLARTADDKGEPGRDSDYGWGLVNVVRALTESVDPVDPARPYHPATDPIDTSDESRVLTSDADSGMNWPLIAAGTGALVLGGVIVLVLVMKRRRSRAS